MDSYRCGSSCECSGPNAHGVLEPPPGLAVLPKVLDKEIYGQTSAEEVAEGMVLDEEPEEDEEPKNLVTGKDGADAVKAEAHEGMGQATGHIWVLGPSHVDGHSLGPGSALPGPLFSSPGTWVMHVRKYFRSCRGHGPGPWASGEMGRGSFCCSILPYVTLAIYLLSISF